MKKYRFETTTTMKPHNNKNWWIDSGIIGKITVSADSLTSALKLYQNEVSTRFYIEISDNALKTKNPMYQDGPNGEAQQIGFVITGKTDFEDRDNYKYTTQYIDLWVTIFEIKNPFSEALG